MANLLVCVAVSAVLFLHGCDFGSKDDANLCSGIFKSSQGAEVMVAYNPAQGRMGATYKCNPEQTTDGCTFFFVPEIHHDLMCNKSVLKVKPEGKDGWQSPPNGTVEGACERANGETEDSSDAGNETQLFFLENGVSRHPPTTALSVSQAVLVIPAVAAAVAAGSIVGMLSFKASRRAPERGTYAFVPDTAFVAEFGSG